MRNQNGVSRRGFVQLMGAAAVASPGLSMFASTSAAKNGFAYVGCSGGEDAIEVFAIRGGRWTTIQRVKSDRPVSMALSADRRFLYVVNEVSEYKGLPVGTVEAYTVARDGRIALLNKQALSLSATMPRHLAISPDGKSVVVTAQGGGAYNLMQLGEDGSVGCASGILKETGTETQAAQPQMAIFDGAGRVVSADQGTGMLSVFKTEDNGLEASARSLTENGSGPLHIAMHSSGKSLYIAHEDALQHFEYDSAAGQIGGRRQHIAGAGVADGSRTLAVHPSGKMLLACNNDKGITAWQTNGSSGALRSIGRYAETWGTLQAIDLSHDGGFLTAISREDGRVLGATIDAATGQVNDNGTLARVKSPVSLAVVLS
ncbi:MAG: beta-propeller fold lactonase family protein [Acidobacteria bacterium]|nr:beta-propeller fold lactonase family protein [Acidobacteriota bacterium]